MSEHFSEDELRRISAFARRPMYEREPEQLLPDGDDPDGPDEEKPAREYASARDER